MPEMLVFCLVFVPDFGIRLQELNDLVIFGRAQQITSRMRILVFAQPRFKLFVASGL